MARQAQALTDAADAYAISVDVIRDAEEDRDRAREVLKASGRDVIYTSDGRAIHRLERSRSGVDLKAARADAKLAAALEAFETVTPYVAFEVKKAKANA